jgi:hypothetical protein
LRPVHRLGPPEHFAEATSDGQDFGALLEQIKNTLASV